MPTMTVVWSALVMAGASLSRRLGDVGDGDGERLLEGGPAAVGGSNADAVAALCLEIKRGGGQERRTTDGESGVVGVALAGHQTVAVRVARVVIGRREGADRGPDRAVLGHATGAQGDRDRRDVPDGPNGDPFLEGEAAAVRGLHENAVGGLVPIVVSRVARLRPTSPSS